MAKKSEKKPVISAAAFTSLLRPRMTEKAHRSLSSGKYVFEVATLATKGSVRVAVEQLYGVTVVGVNLVKTPRRRRIFGRTIGWKSAVKKAIVTLKSGQSIDLIKGV